MILVLAVAASGGARLMAQSTHLSRLEVATPAFVVDPAGAVAFSGWDAAWLVPAAARSLTGLAAGLERDGFSDLVVATGLARVRAGPVWSLNIAQAWIDDLFDQSLLELAPGLAELSTRATAIGLDAAIPVAVGLWASAGGRYELDYLLGDRSTVWCVRLGFSARTSVVGASTTYERGLGATDPGPGVLRAAMSLEWHTARVGVGGRIGRLWSSEPHQTSVGAAGGVTIGGVLVFQGGAGIERNPYADGWRPYASVGLGLRLMPVGVDVRYLGFRTAEGSPLAASLDWTAGGDRRR